MSVWLYIDPDNIDIDAKECEVSLLVTYDDWGSIYGILTFDQIKDIYKQIADREE